MCHSMALPHVTHRRSGDVAGGPCCGGCSTPDVVPIICATPGRCRVRVVTSISIAWEGISWLPGTSLGLFLRSCFRTRLVILEREHEVRQKEREDHAGEKARGDSEKIVGFVLRDQLEPAVHAYRDQARQHEERVDLVPDEGGSPRCRC